MSINTAIENIRWVQNFNLNLGINVLGGIYGVCDVFSHHKEMIEEFYALIEQCDELRRRHGGGTKEFQEMIHPYLCLLDKRLGAKQFEVVSMHYVPFYLEAKERLASCPEFVEWVRNAKPSIMPDIFTQCVMRYAISKLRVSGRIYNTNIDYEPQNLCFIDHLLELLISIWPVTLLLIGFILLLPAHGIGWILRECWYIPDDKSTEYSVWITVTLELIVVAGFFFHKWMKKTGRSYKALLIGPIRFIRTLLRRLEMATRPKE